jgi:predicted  nucleic acid-binding Zn-ribbon protein
MPTVDDLADLQEAEDSLNRSLARLREIRAQYADPEALLQARDKAARLEVEAATLRRRLRELEGEAQAVRTKREQGQQRLYSGTVTNPRELASLEAEGESLGRRLSQLEDQELALMIEIETATEAHQEASTQVQELEREHASRTADLRQEEAGLEVEVARLQQKVALMRERLPAQALSRYESLKARKGGRAVARIRRGTCGACGVQVPTNVVQRAQQRQDLVMCTSCGRILCPD